MWWEDCHTIAHRIRSWVSLSLGTGTARMDQKRNVMLLACQSHPKWALTAQALRWMSLYIASQKKTQTVLLFRNRGTERATSIATETSDQIQWAPPENAISQLAETDQSVFCCWKGFYCRVDSSVHVLPRPPCRAIFTFSLRLHWDLAFLTSTLSLKLHRWGI